MKDTYGRGKIKYLRWTNGRQGSGYKILYLWNWLFDLVIIRYPTGSYINWYTDPVSEVLNHHRINIILRRSKGGSFKIFTDSGREFTILDRIIRFRPDIEKHCVTKVTKGTRWVLSVGWCTK